MVRRLVFICDFNYINYDLSIFNMCTVMATIDLKIAYELYINVLNVRKTEFLKVFGL